jgi:hypothetical protein
MGLWQKCRVLATLAGMFEFSNAGPECRHQYPTCFTDKEMRFLDVYSDIDRTRYSATLAASIITNLWTKFPIIQCLNLLSSSIHRYKLRRTNSGPLSGFDCTSGDCYSLRTARQKRSATESLQQEIKLDISLSRLTLNNLFQSFGYFENKTSGSASLA